MAKESIVDASVPSAGRIYDYLLGGYHNFEVDRRAAQQILKLVPFLSNAVRLQRWCLQDIARELTQNRGFDVIIDFASGLPTQDQIHLVVPEGTTVIYSDYDPVVVEYAREILGQAKDVYYFEADARQPEDLLNRPEVGEILRGKRTVGIVYWGISAFLTDAEIQRIAQTLFAWTGPGSCWVFHAQGADWDPNDPLGPQARKIYEDMGTPTYSRTKEEYAALLKPWHLDENGFISLLDWHGFDSSLLEEHNAQSWGPGGVGYGAYLVK